MKREYSARGDRIVADDPVAVRRYGVFTRINHWIAAAALIVLTLSGFALFSPVLFCLTTLFGGGQATRWLHPLVGVLLVLSFFLLFVQLVRLNLFRREDVTWLAHIRTVMRGREEDLPELGKYNAGQKLVFWAMAILFVTLAVTGVMVWEEFFPHLVSLPVRRVAIALHALAAVGAVLVVILHVYAAIWTRGTLRAMIGGTVTGGWAFRHHRKWLRELAGLRGKPPAN